MKIYTNIGYRLPNFMHPFATETPTLLGIADSPNVTPFLMSSYFADEIPDEVVYISMKSVADKYMLMGAVEHPVFVVQQAHEQKISLPWLGHLTGLQTYVCVVWDDEHQTYRVTSFIPGESWAIKTIRRTVPDSTLIAAQVIGRQADGTLKCISNGKTSKGVEWTQIAYALPWNGPTLEIDKVVEAAP